MTHGSSHSVQASRRLGRKIPNTFVRKAVERVGGPSKHPHSNAKDHQISHVHLSDTILHALDHTLAHTNRLEDKSVQRKPEEVDFHTAHAQNHAKEAMDHMVKLAHHMKNFPSKPEGFNEEAKKMANLGQV